MRVGLGPTPMLYYAVNTLERRWRHHGHRLAQSADHNGFKLMLGKKPFFGDDIQRLGRSPPPATVRGRRRQRCASSRSSTPMSRVCSRITTARGRCMSPGMPATAPPARRCSSSSQQLPGRASSCSTTTIDGTLPGASSRSDRGEEPRAVAGGGAPRGLRSRHRLRWRRRPHRRGRRQGPHPLGRPVHGAAGERCHRAPSPAPPIIADVKASQVLFDEVARIGGTPLMWRTGHSLIKTKMAEIGRAAGRRDERPYLLRRPLLRL